MGISDNAQVLCRHCKTLLQWLHDSSAAAHRIGCLTITFVKIVFWNFHLATLKLVHLSVWTNIYTKQELNGNLFVTPPLALAGIRQSHCVVSPQKFVYSCCISGSEITSSIDQYVVIKPIMDPDTDDFIDPRGNSSRSA